MRGEIFYIMPTPIAPTRIMKNRTKNKMNKIIPGIKIVKKAIQLVIWCASATTPTEMTKDQIVTTIEAKMAGQKIHGSEP